ncbi:MAG: hypothetical protein K2X11_17560 [Acetobacteraceae bacterium]|nr:hypothetical protein [Acetobacteraceae bacterium]
MPCLRPAAFALALIAALPAAAQPQGPDPALQGLSEVRLGVGVLGSDSARRTCDVTPEIQRDLYDLIRTRAAAGGVSIPGVTQAMQPQGNLTMLVGVGPRGRSAPLLLVSVSLLELRQEGGAACAATVITQLRGPVAGRVEATGNPIGREVILWHEDAASIARPDALVGEMLGQAARLAGSFAALTRQPGGQGAPPKTAR